MSRYLLFTLAALAGCTGAPPQPAPTLSAPSEPALTASAPLAPPPPASAAGHEPVALGPAGPPTAGLDAAVGKRTRVPTAVVLFGTSGFSNGEIRFVPVVCSLDGKLATGKACGSAMPERARVRTTRADPSLPAILTVARSTRDFRDEAGGHVYPAPTGPACCMYNTCLGETIPYLAHHPSAEALKVVLAVWPETADVDLKPRPRGADRPLVADGPWSQQPRVTLDQAVLVGSRQLVSLGGRSAAQLWADTGGGWARVDGAAQGADAFDILATADIDGDGQPEVIVHEVWRNDYGLHVLGNDWSKPVYRFSCGNI